MKNISVIILAAGKGTRMKSSLPKVMHKVASREMINLVIDEAKKLTPSEISIVVSEDFKQYRNEIVDNHKNSKISFALQKVRKGTADAVKIGIKSLKKTSDKIIILYGDTPLIHQKTLLAMIEKIDDGNSLCVLGFETKDENMYGRLVVDINGNLEKIIEFKDASPKEKNISLCNSGVIAVKTSTLKTLISQVKNNNASKEFYLTDIVAIARKQKLKCGFIKTNEDEVLGVNSRIELSRIENIKQKELRRKHMEQGVTLIAPETNYFSFDTEIASDVIIEPNVYFGKNVAIESGVKIKSFSYIEGAKIGSNSTIGPFARIRPETIISHDSKIGNFVEIKNSFIKKNSKINHLSYVGDSIIGTDVNIGAGVITCNYDGYNKYKTEIEDGVFVGSNSALIAPVLIKKGAIIGAGSVVTKNVAPHDLAIARSKQVNIKNGAKKIRSKNNKKNK